MSDTDEDLDELDDTRTPVEFVFGQMDDRTIEYVFRKLDALQLFRVAGQRMGILRQASLEEMLDEKRRDDCVCLDETDYPSEMIILPCCGKRYHRTCLGKCRDNRCPNCRVECLGGRWVGFPTWVSYFTWVDLRGRIDEILKIEPARAIAPLIHALRGESEDIVKAYAANKLFDLTREIDYIVCMVNGGVVEPLLQLMHGAYAVQVAAVSLLLRLSTIDASFVAERDLAAAREIDQSHRPIVVDREDWLRMRAAEDGYTYPAGLNLGFSTWVELTSYAMAVAERITDDEWEVREAAVYRLSILGPAMVSGQSPLLCQRIRDRDEHPNVRRAACIVIGTMSANDINYAVESVLYEVLEDGHGERDGPDVIRALLLHVFARLEPVQLVCYVVNIADWLCRGNVASVQSAAMHVLSKLATFASLAYTEAICMRAAEINQYNTDAAVRMLHDEDAGVRSMALCTLGEGDPGVLEQYAGAVVHMIQDRDAGVRRMALRVLNEIDPEVLHQYAGMLMELHGNHPDVGIRESAFNALRVLRLPPHAM